MPGFASTVCFQRTLFTTSEDDLVPEGIEGCGKTRPMPDPPPVIRIVLQARFIWFASSKNRYYL
jgi:hypothetical protein